MPKAKYVPPSNRTIVITCMAARPARLQPSTLACCKDQYYSCSSEDSEPEESVEFKKSQYPSPDTKLNKTQAILQLLQEIISLLNTNVSKTEEPLQTPAAASSAIQEKYSGIPPTAPESEMNLPPPPPPPPEPEIIPATVPHWCPCYCFAQGMAMATGQPPIMPCMQPFNIQAAASYEQPVPKPFVFEGTDDSFKDCFSSSVASAMAKDADFVCVPISSVDEEGPPCICPVKDEPPCTGKSDYEREIHVEDIDEEVTPVAGVSASFDHHKSYGPGRDSLEQYEDEEPTREIDEEVKPVIERPSFDHHKNYGPGLDSLEQYEDEEPTPKHSKQIMPVIVVETPIAPSVVVDADREPIQEVEKGPETDQIVEPEQSEQPAPEATEGEIVPETDRNVEPEQTVPEANMGEIVPETDGNVEPEQTAPEANVGEIIPETDRNVEPEQIAPATTDQEIDRVADNNVELEPPEPAPTDDGMTDGDQSTEKQLIRYVDSDEDDSCYPYDQSEIYDGDSELAKEKFAESYKQKETPEEEDNENRLQEMVSFSNSSFKSDLYKQNEIQCNSF